MVHEYDRYWFVLVAIGIIALVVGFTALIVPDTVMQHIASSLQASPLLNVRLVGLVTCASGVSLLYGVWNRFPLPGTFLWSALMKFILALTIGAAVQASHLQPILVYYGAYELATAVMIVSYWFWIKQRAAENG